MEGMKPRWQWLNERVEVVATRAAVYNSIWGYSLRGYDILGWGLGQRWLSPRGASQHKRGRGGAKKLAAGCPPLLCGLVNWRI